MKQLWCSEWSNRVFYYKVIKRLLNNEVSEIYFTMPLLQCICNMNNRVQQGVCATM